MITNIADKPKGTMKLSDLYKNRKTDKDALISSIEDFVKNNLKTVKHHQLRNLLDLVIWVKQSHTGLKTSVLESKTLGRVAILKPKVAYMAAREEKLKGLRVELNEILSCKDNFKFGSDLEDLYDFASAIVAYHKLYGDK